MTVTYNKIEELDIDAQNTFSDPVLVDGAFSFSLLGTAFTGTVTIQRRFNNDDTWRDINTFTTDFEGNDYQAGSAQLRFGIKTGEYSSGSVLGRLGS
jgi:hypothetical protein